MFHQAYIGGASVPILERGDVWRPAGGGLHVRWGPAGRLILARRVRRRGGCLEREAWVSCLGGVASSAATLGMGFLEPPAMSCVSALCGHIPAITTTPRTYFELVVVHDRLQVDLHTWASPLPRLVRLPLSWLN